MKTLENALKSTLENLPHPNEDHSPTSSRIGQPQTLGGILNNHARSLTPSVITGVPSPDKRELRQIGQPLGETGAAAIPKTAEEAVEMAEKLVGTSLPLSISLWLDGEEYFQANGLHKMVPGTGAPASKPEKTPELIAEITNNLKSLSELLKPARERGGELEMEIAKLFAVFNVFTGDEGKTKLQVSAWADDLENYPLFAIRKAAKWARQSEKKMPSLSEFLSDVRLAMGSNVLARKKLLQNWLSK